MTEGATSITAETDAFLRRIRREKIVVPGPGQYVDRCQYSKTGWGVWNEAKDGHCSHCTCKPAKAPPASEEPKR